MIIYKIDPVKGSENATGYHLAKEIIQIYPDTVLITQTKNIRKLKNDPYFSNADCAGIDVPQWLSFFKNKERGLILYYYLWQVFVGRLVKKLDNKHTFNVIHQINFHTDWAPHFITSKNAKIIWGPLVHHPMLPWSWLPKDYWSDYVNEVVKQMAKFAFWFANPFLKRAINRTDQIVFGNPYIPKPYQSAGKSIAVMPYAGSHWLPTNGAKENSTEFRLLFTGRFVALKGPHLALDAFTLFLKHLKQMPLLPRLTLVGTGPLESHLQKQAEQINASRPGSVSILPWLRREDLPEHYRQADYFLYPSLESQGLVVSEAITQGCPVITLAQTGPAYVSQNEDLTVACDYHDYEACVQALAKKLTDLYDKHCQNDREIHDLRQKTLQRAQSLSWPAIANKMMMFYPVSDDPRA